MMAMPSAHSLIHGFPTFRAITNSTDMITAEEKNATTWIHDLGSSAIPRTENAPTMAAPGTTSMMAGLTLRRAESPFFSSGVRISVAIIHMAPPRLMAARASPKTACV